MPLRKIRDLPCPSQLGSPYARLPCMNPEHNPPLYISLEPGEYEYECPGCGEKRTFIAIGGSPGRTSEGSPYDASQGGAKVLKGKTSEGFPYDASQGRAKVLKGKT